MFTEQQVADLKELYDVAGQFEAEAAIIGASAIQCFVGLGRFTQDIDLVVALDLEDFERFAGVLKARHWRQEPNREHRWHGANGSLIDLIPAGPKLLAAGQVVWPKSRFAMSLAGYDQVFERAVTIPEFGDDRFKAAPPALIVLLKITAITDDPFGRLKDLDDLKALMQGYAKDSDRLFGDDVFDAELEDFEFANAFLLGKDVGAIASGRESELVDGFLARQMLDDEALEEFDTSDRSQAERLRFQRQLRAFKKGLDGARGNRGG